MYPLNEVGLALVLIRAAPAGHIRYNTQNSDGNDGGGNSSDSPLGVTVSWQQKSNDIVR
jgi:hypothetical protein